MFLTEGMLLYHGSYVPVEKPNLALCAANKDFGQGIYLTSSLQQARQFIRASVIKAQQRGIIPMSQHFGYVSSYRFRPSGEALTVHVFPQADREWLWFIAQNRRRQLAAVLAPKLTGIADADVMAGKVANDQTNPVITAYLSGLYGDILSEEAIQDAVKRLLPEHLVDQFCFRTERAIACLEFVEAKQYVYRAQ